MEAPEALREPRSREPVIGEELRKRRRRRQRIEEDQEEAVFREVVSFTPDPLPVRCYDKDTTTPISFYLSSLEELLAWTPDTEDGFNRALGPAQCRQPPLSGQRPRTLLCHDMMGGYLNDRFVQGSAASSAYVFYHWQHIDVFVYFSHHMVTVPPVGWTNAAHRHGVCVLGTFITEWRTGGEQCEAFLAGDGRAYQAVADQLVLMAQFLQFDGWLVNIENSLSVSTACLVVLVPPRPCLCGLSLHVLVLLTHTQACFLWRQLEPPLASQGELAPRLHRLEMEPSPALCPET